MNLVQQTSFPAYPNSSLALWLSYASTAFEQGLQGMSPVAPVAEERGSPDISSSAQHFPSVDPVQPSKHEEF